MNTYATVIEWFFYRGMSKMSIAEALRVELKSFTIETKTTLTMYLDPLDAVCAIIENERKSIEQAKSYQP